MANKKRVKVTLDARRDRLDLRDREYRPPLKPMPKEWPSKEHIENYFPLYADMVLDQGTEGACTGFGLAAVINYLLWREALQERGKDFDKEEMLSKLVSPYMLYSMARVYDEWEGEDYEGSSCRGAMKGWHRHGACRAKLWSSSSKKPNTKWSVDAVKNPLGAYYRINKDSVVDMQAAIVEVGAIYCSAMVHTGWQTLGECDTLPLIKYSKERVGGHAFAIVGYNRDGFIVQNSWGSKWGFKGFAVISYKEWVESAQDAWVSVRGAPLEITDSPDTFSSMPLQAVGTDYNKLDNVLLSKALKYNYSNPQIAPWSEQKAYQHSLVIGNDGRPKHTIISAPSVEASAEIITYENVKGWMQKSKKNRKVLIYAHGGLNSEQSSINRVRVMAPYFKANGVYPLFITWKTGFLESITDQIEDKLHSSFKEAGIVPSSAKAKGILEKLQEAIDRAIEDFSRKVVVKGVWSEMKENAAYANDRAVPGYSQHGDTKAGGMVLLAKSLKKLKEEFDCELHIVGHSAGSILLGHWLDELSRREVVLNSCTLYAPACTVEFANKYYIAAHKNGTLSKSAIDIYMMDDEREKADNVGPYKKSLLYLVSRALEDIHKTPLLGMAASWDIEYAKENSVFNQIKYPALKRWIKFSKGIRTHIYTKLQSQVPTSLNGDTIRLSHGSFDNNIEIIEETIKRVSKKDSLEFPVENLNGY